MTSRNYQQEYSTLVTKFEQHEQVMKQALNQNKALAPALHEEIVRTWNRMEQLVGFARLETAQALVSQVNNTEVPHTHRFDDIEIQNLISTTRPEKNKNAGAPLLDTGMDFDLVSEL